MERDRIGERVLAALLPALAFALLYAPTLDYGFVWTDETAIAAGTVPRPAGQTWQAFREPLHRIEHRGPDAQQRYYRPLPVAMLSLVDQRAGREPRPFRLTALLVGAVCAGAFGVFARWVLGSTGAGLFAGLLAAVHPVAIESTVWIVAMPAALAALLVIAALGLALESRTLRTLPSAAALAALSVLMLALALLSKERAAVEPALLIAALVCLGGGARPGWSSGVVAVHVVVVAAYTFWLRPLVLGTALLPLPPIEGSAFTQVLTGIADWPRQLGWLFAPLRSSTSDTVRVVGSLADPLLWVGGLLALGSAVGFFVLLRVGRRVAAFGLAWIWIAIAPSAGLVPMLHPSGERYLYLSAFGAALFVTDLGRTFVARLPAKRQRVVAFALSALVVGALAQRTCARLPDWESSETLFKADLSRDPSYREAHFMLAANDFESGRHAEASTHLSVLLVPTASFDPFAGTAGYLNWIVVAELACQNELALDRYRRILEIEQQLRRENPAVTRAPNFQLCYGQAHDALGHTEKALRLYLSVARQLGPATPPMVLYMIARNHSQLGQRPEALEWIEQANRASVAEGPQRQRILELRARLHESRTSPDANRSPRSTPSSNTSRSGARPRMRR